MATIKKMENKIFLKSFQDKFIFSEKKFSAFVAGWATGKTMAGIMKAMLISQKYKNNLGIIFRKQYTDLRDSTIFDFEKYTNLKVNSQRNAVLPNGSVIMFRHLEELNNIQNMNLGFFMIEQAEELDTDTEFFTLWGRLRRQGTNLQGFITANTKGHNWVWKLFKVDKIKDPKTGEIISELIEARTRDNVDVLPAEYISSLEILKEKKPALYNRFVMNSWEEDDVSDYIIKRSLAELAVKVKLAIADRARVVISCDPARYGDDETAIIIFNDYKVFDTLYLRDKSTMETAGELSLLINKHNSKLAVIDVIGLGVGVYDRLKELTTCDLIAFNSAEKCEDEKDQERYVNKRAEAWLKVSELFDKQKVSIPDDWVLVEQLSNVKYGFVNGKFKVEDKAEIKKRLGCSPDRADALVQGLWAVEKCKYTYDRNYDDLQFKFARNVAGY